MNNVQGDNICLVNIVCGDTSRRLVKGASHTRLVFSLSSCTQLSYYEGALVVFFGVSNASWSPVKSWRFLDVQTQERNAGERKDRIRVYCVLAFTSKMSTATYQKEKVA